MTAGRITTLSMSAVSASPLPDPSLIGAARADVIGRHGRRWHDPMAAMPEWSRRLRRRRFCGGPRAAGRQASRPSPLGVAVSPKAAGSDAAQIAASA